ncbi:MAG: DEAD/DEAH box helicase [Sediminibacterium sp.]
MKFTDCKLDERLLEGIDSMGYENATPVQEQVMQPILDGNDIIASAQTGTGKTAAFLLPLINRLLTEPQEEQQVKAMIIVPTRELAVQIEQTLEGLSYFTSISSIAVYGGGDGINFATEKKALSSGVDIVICTPGRMITHLNMGYVRVKGLKYLVLDEADRMLDMGFHDDIMKIIGQLPKQRQTLLFSATMPPKMRELGRKILNAQPMEINIAVSKPPEQIVQEAFVVYEPQKIPLIRNLLAERAGQIVIVFCSSKQAVKQLTRELKKAGIAAAEIHSDLEQNQREQVMLDFHSGKTKVLVATDILSRGIDVDNIDLVINYDVPRDGEDYVHRIGRTARAESKGTAYTFIIEKEQSAFARIEKLLRKEVTKREVPAELGPTPVYNPRASRHQGGGGRKPAPPRGKKTSGGENTYAKDNRHLGFRSNVHRPK